MRHAGKSVVALNPSSTILVMILSEFFSDGSSAWCSHRSMWRSPCRTPVSLTPSFMWYALSPIIRSASTRLDVPVRPSPAPMSSIFGVCSPCRSGRDQTTWPWPSCRL